MAPLRIHLSQATTRGGAGRRLCPKGSLLRPQGAGEERDGAGDAGRALPCHSLQTEGWVDRGRGWRGSDGDGGGAHLPRHCVARHQRHCGQVVPQRALSTALRLSGKADRPGGGDDDAAGDLLSVQPGEGGRAHLPRRPHPGPQPLLCYPVTPPAENLRQRGESGMLEGTQLRKGMWAAFGARQAARCDIRARHWHYGARRSAVPWREPDGCARTHIDGGAVRSSLPR
mmetsp:Transcript_2887/g.5165  ORF Transcript_2887/g.5165 Transcript_2887/m.5165 type:complete len:228 (-) Transcript_2887:233-916(-)